MDLHQDNDKRTTPYIDAKIVLNIALEPSELNNDILFNIKNKLKRMEKRCHSFGYLDEVYTIYKYENGFLPPEDLMCKAVYTVTFHCRICDPPIDIVIPAKIRKIDPTIISMDAGPIRLIMQSNRLDERLELFGQGTIRVKDKSNVVINKNSYVWCKVLAKKFNNGDKYIQALSSITDVCDEDDYNKIYEQEPVDKDKNKTLVEKVN